MYPSFAAAIGAAQEAIRLRSHRVDGRRWQGIDVSGKPEMATYEILNWSFESVVGTTNLQLHRDDIRPNLPWADDHFEERVGGWPLNPGVEWANWPYAKSADRFREAGRFTHSYMERYWPKYAGLVQDDEKGMDPAWVVKNKRTAEGRNQFREHLGIRYSYGDLNDVVELLRKDPDTRQAYLPVWFPEDTGNLHGGRLPCSIGYHFIQRFGYLHVVYQLRSCDFVRHFRDDIYLTVRLLLWVLKQLGRYRPGIFTMHITSLHIFRADWHPLFGVERKDEGPTA